jgi:hypothetical protein
MIEIKGNQGEKVFINIHRRLYPDAIQNQDIDFLEATIKISFPEFTALFRFFIRSSEIEYWIRQRNELIILRKRIRFATLEENMVINLQIEENEISTWNFELRDQEHKSKLYLRLESELATVDLFMNQLANVLKLYPIPTYV